MKIPSDLIELFWGARGSPLRPHPLRYPCCCFLLKTHFSEDFRAPGGRLGVVRGSFGVRSGFVRGSFGVVRGSFGGRSVVVRFFFGFFFEKFRNLLSRKSLGCPLYVCFWFISHYAWPWLRPWVRNSDCLGNGTVVVAAADYWRWCCLAATAK